MTERRKDGKKKRPRKVSVEVACQEFIDGLETALKEDPTSEGSRLVWVVILNLIQTGLKHLKHYIETDHADINWSNPYVQLEYDAERKHPGRLTEVEKQLNITAENFFELFPAGMELGVMHVLTRGVEIHRDQQFVEANGRLYNVHVVMPPQVEAEVNALPENEQAAKVTELFEGRRVGPKLFVFAKDTFKTEPFAADLVFVIKPLVVDTIADRTYYPVVVGLNFTAGDPASWSDADQKDFWDASFKALNDEIDRLLESGQPRHKVKKPDQVKAVSHETFPVAAGFAPMHHLAKRDRAELPLFPDESRRFHQLRTPLNWAVGMALFYHTAKDSPGDWQEVRIADLEDRVFCLTERNAPRRGDYRTDILAEVLKLHSEKNYYVRYNWERVGCAWKRTVVLGSDYAVPNLEIEFMDKQTGRRVIPSDPALRSLTVPLEVKGRRVYAPDGSRILALPPDRYKMYRIRWRWNPSFADDLKAAPVLDQKGKVRRDAAGKVLRGGFNIQVAERIFNALTILRKEKAYVAHDLLVLLAHDIYKPPKQSTAAGRNMVEREATHLYDLLGMVPDPKHPDRIEQTVAAAIYRLKQPDIAALLPGSDEVPRPPSEAEKKSGRRKSPFYRLVRSPEFTPAAAIVTKEEADVLKAGEGKDVPALPPAKPPARPGRKMKQKSLPGLEAPPPPTVPSGADIRAAREAAGLTLRAFAEQMAGPDFSTWSRYESGKPIRVGKVPSDVWQRVADFIAQHKPKADA